MPITPNTGSLFHAETHKKAADLEWRAAHNRAEADKLINNGAAEDFVQELRDRAIEMEAEAARLRDPLKRRGKA